MPKHFRIVAFLLMAGLVPAALAGQTATASDQVVQTGVTLGEGEASLDLELANGRTLRVRLADGVAYVDGRAAGRYTPGGALETAWREFLRKVSDGELSRALADFSGAGYGADDPTAAAIAGVLAAFSAGSSGEVSAATVSGGAATADESSSTAGEAAEEAAAAAPAETQRVAGERVKGGLVVELQGIEDMAQSLRRIGLAPGLARLLDGDFRGPVRIVIDADEYVLPEGATLAEPLILIQTDGVLAGTVQSNVLVAKGSVLLAPTARIEGDVIAVDATVQNRGTVLGSLREASGLAPIVLAPGAPARARAPSARPSFLRSVWGGLGSLAKTVAMYLLFAFMGALVVYFFRGHLETVSDTVSYSFGRSFLAGLAAEVLFFPIGLVMTLLIITAIAVPFYVLGFVLLALLGYIGVAHAAGENLTRHRFSWPARARRSNSYYYVLNGLGVLLALFAGTAMTQMAYPLLGWAHDLLIVSAWILTWVAATSGLGAALISRGGTKRSYARPHELPDIPVDTLAERMAAIEAQAARRRQRQESDDEA